MEFGLPGGRDNGEHNGVGLQRMSQPVAMPDALFLGMESFTEEKIIGKHNTA